MKGTNNQLTFTAPIARESRQIAEKFRRQQSDPIKAERVYRNTLAVLAVNYYCKCMGIETDLAGSDSWDLIMQTLADVADLQIKNWGKIECRPVLSDSDAMEIPAEVWGERMGYVAVRLNEKMLSATLLGFAIAPLETELYPLSKLQSLEDFIVSLDRLKSKPPIHLSRWFDRVVEAGWETVETLLNPPKPELAFNFRQRRGEESKRVKRGKLLDLARGGERVALLVGMEPMKESEIDIWVEVHPTGIQTHLPSDLQLMVLDEAGEAVMQAQARKTENIQLNFSGEVGEKFSVKVRLGEVSVTEGFII